MYELPSAENWPGARSDLKLFYRSTANNTLTSAGYTFKFVTQSVKEYLRSYFFRIIEYRDAYDRKIREDDRGSPIERIIEFPHECFVSQSYVSSRGIKIFEFFIYLKRNISLCAIKFIFSHKHSLFIQVIEINIYNI